MIGTNARKEWTWGELEVLFESQFGKVCGNKTMELDGCTMTRSLRRQPSNSGKTHTWKIDFIVFYADGDVIIVNDLNNHLNRANDANRNWGMGRE